MRVHNPGSEGHAACDFRYGDSAVHRFDHHQPGASTGVLYAATAANKDDALATAVSEVLTTMNGASKARAVLKWQIARLIVTDDAHLLDLTGPNLMAQGLNGKIGTSDDRKWTQQWARWWHENFESIHGLIWMSRAQPARQVVCFNERAVPLVRCEWVMNLGDADGMTRFLVAANSAQCRFTRPAMQVLESVL